MRPSLRAAADLAEVLVGAEVKRGSLRLELFGRRHSKVCKMHIAVGFRPEPDSPGHRLGKRVLQVQFTIEVTLDFRAADSHLQVVPLPARRRRVSNPLHR